MKRSKLTILFILPLLALVGCKTDISTTNSEHHSSSTGPNPISTTTKPSNKELIQKVMASLTDVSKASSYTVNSEEDDGTGMGTLKLKDIYTPSYISIGYKNGGYLTLPSYDSSLGSTMVYEFKYDTSKNIVLGKAVTYYDSNDQLKVVKDCTDMNYMKLITSDSKYSLSESMFSVEGDSVVTTDEDLLYILSHQMGYSPYTDDYIITSARFELSDAGLTFYLYNQIDTDSTATELLIKATFTDLNKTSDTKLAQYIEDYKLPESALDDDTFSELTRDTVGFDTQIRYRSGNGFVDFGSISLTSYYDKDNTKNNLMAYRLIDSINNEEYSYVLSVGENGKAIDHYIDGNNKQASQPFDNSDYYWGNGIFSIQEEIDNTFLSSDSSNYQYYGINIDRLYESITAISVLTDLSIKSVDSLILSKTDDAIKLEAELSGFYYDSDGNAVDLSINTISTLQKNPVIEIPQSYDAGEASDKLSNAFNLIKNQNSYVARGYGLKADGTEASSLSSNSYYMKKDEYFILNQTDRDNYVTTIKGYKQVGNDLIPFVVDKHGQVSQSGEIIPDQDLSSVVPWNLSPNLFDQVSNLTFEVKDHVKNENECMFGGSTLLAMLDSSLKIKLDDLGRLDTVNYQYVYRGILAGKEELKFEYSSEQALPSFIDQDSFDKLNGQEQVLTSWSQEKDTTIYKMLVKTFGQEIADTIPYLYDKDIANTWNLGTNYDGTGDMCIYSNSAKISAFMEKYKAEIQSLGYQETTIEGRTYYVKDTIRIRFGQVESEIQDFSNYLYFGVNK